MKETSQVTKNSAVLCGILSVLMGATLVAQPVSFNMLPRDYSVGGQPIALAKGDFNGDGKLDIVTPLDFASNGVAVLLGTGTGSFGEPIISPGAISTTGFVVGDFNGDGKLDLAFDGVEDAFMVRLGNGDGTFQPPVTYPLAFTPIGIFTADLNHDGKLDLVVSSVHGRSGFIAVLLGKGNGTFLAPKELPTGEPSSFVLGDFNHDGNVDIAVSTGDNIQVLLGTGTGSFLAPVFSFDEIGEITSMLSADLNGDGNPDLVVNTKQNTPSPALVLAGNGDGTFQTGSPLAFVGFIASISDMNGDGNLDLVGSSSSKGNTGVIVALGNGDATFGNPTTATPVSLGFVGPLTGNFRAHSETLDVVTAGTGGVSISFLYNKGNGTFVAPTALSIPGGAGSITASDLNHDGEPDLITVAGSEIAVLLGKGNGTFESAVTYPAGKLPNYVAVGDFNNDGNPDLAVCDNGNLNTIAILFGNGDGTFQPARTVTVTGDIVSGTLAAADFDKDGNLDLAVNSTAFSTLLILMGNGDGTFQPAKAVAVGFTPQFVAAADFNHDGKPDLIAGGAGSASVLLGNGDGTFQGGPIYSSLADNLFPAAIGDLNGDGNLDVVIPGYSDQSPSGIFVLLGNGNGTFQPPTNYPGFVPFSAGLADFNEDGKLDVVLGNSGEGNDVPVLLGNGDGTFGRTTYYPGGFAPSGVAAADLNHDNKPDIAIGSNSGVIVLLSKSK